jgi:homoserine dehydrogenase
LLGCGNVAQAVLKQIQGEKQQLAGTRQ